MFARKFNLRRLEDETGVSGVGIVTEGYELSDGICVMKWLTATSSIAVYASIIHVQEIHGHQGKTMVEFESGKTYSEVELPLWAVDPIGYIKLAKEGLVR